MESNEKALTGKRQYARLGTLGVFVLLVAIAVWWSSKMTSVMWSAAASDPNAVEANTGEMTKIVIEVAEVSGEGKIRGTVLKEKTKEVYTRTGNQISVKPDSETKFVMGKAEDIHPKAVVHVTGRMQEDRSVAAQQIVILTGYVKIE